MLLLAEDRNEFFKNRSVEADLFLNVLEAFVKKLSFYTKNLPLIQPFSTYYLLKGVCKKGLLCYYSMWLILTMEQCVNLCSL